MPAFSFHFIFNCCETAARRCMHAAVPNGQVWEPLVSVAKRKPQATGDLHGQADIILAVHTDTDGHSCDSRRAWHTARSPAGTQQGVAHILECQGHGGGYDFDDFMT